MPVGLLVEHGLPVLFEAGEVGHIQGLHEVGGVSWEAHELDVVLPACLDNIRREVGRQVITYQHLLAGPPLDMLEKQLVEPLGEGAHVKPAIGCVGIHCSLGTTMAPAIPHVFALVDDEGGEHLTRGRPAEHHGDGLLAVVTHLFCILDSASKYGLKTKSYIS